MTLVSRKQARSTYSRWFICNPLDQKPRLTAHRPRNQCELYETTIPFRPMPFVQTNLISIHIVAVSLPACDIASASAFVAASITRFTSQLHVLTPFRKEQLARRSPHL